MSRIGGTVKGLAGGGLPFQRRVKPTFSQSTKDKLAGLAVTRNVAGPRPKPSNVAADAPKSSGMGGALGVGLTALVSLPLIGGLFGGGGNSNNATQNTNGKLNDQLQTVIDQLGGPGNVQLLLSVGCACCLCMCCCSLVLIAVAT